MMLNNRPKGISINRNALNIQANNQPSGRTPSPPKLKSFATSNNAINKHQQLLLEPLLPIKQLSAENDDTLIAAKAAVTAKAKAIMATIDEIAEAKAKAAPEPLVAPTPAPAEAPSEKPLVRQQSRIPRISRVVEEEVIEDIDLATSRDAIFLVCDVAKDIYSYMYDLEKAQSVRLDYLKEQKIMTPKVRQRLVNWCIDIHRQLKLLPETLYMTIAVIDRYFDRVTVTQQKQVQLIGVGATLVASKYEEIYPPDVEDLIYLTQNVYSKEEIFRSEIEILQKLDFDLGRPIPLAFLRRFSKAAHCDLKMHSIAKFLMEISLTEYECAHWNPSLLAAAALFTTVHLVYQHQQSSTDNDNRLTTTTSSSSMTSSISSFGLVRRPLSVSSLTNKVSTSTACIQDRWTKTLVHYTTYTRAQLQEPAATLCKILKRVMKSPQSYNAAKKNLANISKWLELKSTRVDEIIRMDHSSPR